MSHNVINASISPTDSHPSTFGTTKISCDITEATASPTENYQLSDSIIRTSHNVTDATTAPTEGERPTYHPPTQIRALHETSPADRKASMSSVYKSPSKSPPTPETATPEESEEMDAQDRCLLFKLPPELRNAIYAYAINRTHGQYGWVEDQDGPKISLFNAKKCAPSNELMRTCRRIYAEGRGIFVQAQRDFWSQTTFTFGLGGGRGERPDRAAACLDSLCEEQISSIRRLTIKVHAHALIPFKLHLSAADGSDPTSWAMEEKVPSGTVLKTAEISKILKGRLLGINHSHGHCQCPSTYAQLRTRIFMAMRDYYLFGPSMEDVHGAGTTCELCGRMESVYPVVQDTRKMELMVLVARICHCNEVG